MLSSTIYLAVATFGSALVNAHGKLAVATGDLGGNTTALAIMGGIVPGAGPNSETEVDTTVFKSRNAASDGLGRTKGNGPNTMAMMDSVIAQSGSTLPQVSSNGGHIDMIYHIVTTDGAGPVKAIIDPTATGKFSQGQEADVETQVPGRNGNIKPGPLRNNLSGGGKGQKGGILGALGLRGLTRRALNVNTDHPVRVAIPAGTSCSGTVGGMQNVCLLKVANPSRAGPFGGVMAFQMAPAAKKDTDPTSSTSSVGAGKSATGFAGPSPGTAPNGATTNGANADDERTLTDDTQN